jgi:hypothetical protein
MGSVEGEDLRNYRGWLVVAAVYFLLAFIFCWRLSFAGVYLLLAFNHCLCVAEMAEMAEMHVAYRPIS